jgi:2,3-bisphosphoglycerate-dependent phosphoglycerate mutase
MELYFIRHAQSENNANLGRDDYQESSDPELTKIGRAQAQYLAKFLADNQSRDEEVAWNNQNRHGFGLTHLYTSLMVRAVDTGTTVAEVINLPLVAWPEIHEAGGIFSRIPEDEMAGLPGKSRSYFEQYFPNLVLPDGLGENGWWNRPFEEVDARKPRADRVWRELLARHADRPGQPEHRVAFFSHGGFFMYLLTAALNVEMRRIEEFKHEYWFIMNNCGITYLDVKDGQVLVAYTNRTDFLSDDLIT